MKLIALAMALAIGGAAMAQASAPQDMTPPETQTVDDPKGGYQPAGPALSGPVPPGARIVIVPSKSATEAYPPPPPLANYPWCKPGQYDNCKQRRDPK